MHTKIKICGLTSVADTKIAVGEGAAIIGLNFYCKSPRFLGIKKANEIFEIIPDEVLIVGVFVNEEVSKIKKILEEVPLDALQFHGDESLEFCSEFKNKLTIKTFRITDDFDFKVLTKYQKFVDYFLIDKYSKDVYGGTGQEIADDLLDQYPKELWPKTILAGGLNIDNVAKKIEKYRPFAVDVASGVETVVGKKGKTLIEKFTREVKMVNQI